MDDDLMLNISRPANSSIAQKNIKAEGRKQKYSFTGKKNRRQNKYKLENQEHNLLPTQPQEKVQKQEPKKEQENKELSSENPKRSRNFEREDNEQSKPVRGYKRYKRQEYESRQPKQKAILAIKPASIKITTPNQIQPELMSIQNKIDVNPFDQFNLNPLLLKSLVSNQIGNLTDIQIKCYKPIFNRQDVIAKASTGSGKTLAYLIPLLNQYLQNKTITERVAGTVLLVICPTRELCVQGQKEALRCLKRCPFIVPGCLIGGQQTNHQKNRLRKGINLLFSTPGRLIYHLKNTQAFKLDKIKTLIFEQADRTLDMGFQKDVIEMIKILKEKIQINYTQKILVSAHFNQKVEGLIQNLSMDNPSYIGFQKQNQDVQNQTDQEINISKNLKQQYLLMGEQERIPLVVAYLKLIRESKVMIFASTIDEVQYLDFLINNMRYRDSNGVMTDQKIQSRRVFKIHGDLDQKYRTNTYLEFRKEKCAILISTEVASRGLDFPDLNHIILFDVPPTLADYGNRVGRSARFNSSGVSLLMLHYQESDYAQKIRFYCPKLQVLEKDVIFEGFSKYLNKLNIKDDVLHYLQGLVRGLIKDDDQKYSLARRAYVSMLRAYSRMKDRHIFAVKRLDLKLLGRCFGINSTGGKPKKYNPKAKESHLEAKHKKRKVESIRSLQVSEYM